MGIFDGCIITSDVDDTLVSSGYINPKNIEKIEFFMRQGGIFSLATGRTANALSGVTSQLKHFSPSVVANGSMIFDFTTNEVVYDVAVPTKDHKLLEQVIKRGLPVGVEVHSGYKTYSPLQNSESDFHKNYEGFQTIDCDFETVDKVRWNKFLFFSENIELYDEIRKIAEDIGFDSTFVSSRMVFEGLQHNFLEVVPKGVSKATAITKLCEIFNIKKGCCYAIGDFYNDIAMLENADIAAATADSPEEVKAVADYITVPCKDGAVADFIDYLTQIHKTV